MEMKCTFAAALLVLLATSWVATAEEDEEELYNEEAASERYGDDGEGARTASSVYIMEHGFLSGEKPTWLPRGTLLLSSFERGGGFEARLSDAKEFVDMRQNLQSLMATEVEKRSYYAIRMYSPEKPKRVLQASIPAKLLADHFEDWHDILEVTMGSAGVPVSLSYRVKHTLGLMLFDHTQVHLSEPGRAEGPRIAPLREGSTGPGGTGGGEDQAGGQSFLRKYWWVIIIVLLLLTNASDDGSAGKKDGGGGGSGGGGGGGGGRRAAAN